MNRRQLISAATAATVAAPFLSLSPARAAATQANSPAMNRLADNLTGQIASLCQGAMIPGFVAGVYHAGEQITLPYGIRNVNTGDPMTADTGWLLGSVTKTLTTTLLLQFVDRGQLDLDAKAVRYVPEFRLEEPGTAEQITVRQLINHTNGIDADALMPTAEFGPNAIKSYVDTLQRCGTLSPPGEHIHYSNPGFSVAGRIIEKLTGKPFNQVLQEQLHGPAGMTRAVTSAELAMLNRTAVGSFPDPAAGKPRQTNMFMLPVSGAAAGTTEIVTMDDILTFGRTHLNRGVAPNGTRILSETMTQAMRTTTFDLQTPNQPPMGLGWWLVPMGGTTVLWHGGGSPGGMSSLAVVPEHDLVVASFGNSPGSRAVHDAVAIATLEGLLGLKVELPFEMRDDAGDMGHYSGTYSHFQTREHFAATPTGLAWRSEFVPFDDEHLRFLASYSGRDINAEPAEAPAVELKPLHRGLFARADVPLEAWRGLWARLNLMSFHGDDGSGQPQFMNTRFRAARRT